ncbi:membrane-bound alkaline phosphatase-like [Haematobia irritans]|uniref:membrane-bound alkaline phosphatase-like n=1 Tax=Haematobia irritans TaxID=7368 RepID=UPI003F4FDB9B
MLIYSFIGIVILLLGLAGHAHVIDDTAFHSPRNLLGKPSISPRLGVETMGTNRVTPEKDKNPEYWRSIAKDQVLRNIQRQQLNMNKAKNIIMFMGDGMSLNTITAARILKGQRHNQTGEEGFLSFENFPRMALSKTYCANAQVPDSACTATAYLCGVKANIVTIGVSANVEYNNCSASMDPVNQVSSIAAWAQRVGKSTGFITTTTLTHASPSGTYAHVSNRLHESDTDVLNSGNDPKTCMDIASQLITQEPGRNFNIMMGGGMSKFLPETMKDTHGNYGIRKDGKNLLSTWQAMHPQGILVTNRNQLLNVNTSKVSNIMGIFQSKAMDYHALANNTYQPSLSEMTEVALNLLKRNDQGYFIFIEGGHIDTAHHENKAGISLHETLEFEKAVQLARDMTDPRDTLIVVTADHSHSMSISGYPSRGNPILGLNEHTISADGLKYSVLNYAVGTQQYEDDKGHRLDLENIPWKTDSIYPSYIKTDDGYHGGDDVGVYTSGPFDHMFTGVLEQNTIPYLMSYAACIGDGPTMCDAKKC